MSSKNWEDGGSSSLHYTSFNKNYSLYAYKFPKKQALLNKPAPLLLFFSLRDVSVGFLWGKHISPIHMA